MIEQMVIFMLKRGRELHSEPQVRVIIRDCWSSKKIATP